MRGPLQQSAASRSAFLFLHSVRMCVVNARRSSTQPPPRRPAVPPPRRPLARATAAVRSAVACSVGDTPSDTPSASPSLPSATVPDETPTLAG
jgi:hypothetical protein